MPALNGHPVFLPERLRRWLAVGVLALAASFTLDCGTSPEAHAERVRRARLGRPAPGAGSIVTYGPGGFCNVKPGVRVDPHVIFDRFPGSFGLGPDDRMVVYDSVIDNLGIEPMVHYRFQQYHQGLVVENAVAIVHAKQGLAVSVNGDLRRGIEKLPRRRVSEPVALNAAMKAAGARIRPWEVDSIRRRPGVDSEMIARPSGVLVVIRPSDLGMSESDRHVVAWKFLIIPYPSYDPREVYIDATTGKVISNRSTIIVN